MEIRVNRTVSERCGKLKRKEKIFITFAILLTIVFCGGLYINHQLDRFVTALSSTGLLFVYPEDKGSSILPPGESDPGGAAGTETLPPGSQSPEAPPPGKNGAGGAPGAADHNPAAGYNPENSGEGGGEAGGGSGAANNGATGDSRLESDIIVAVQQKLGRPLDKKDMLKAGLIILRKLNTEEISYLYSVGRRNSYTREEYQRVQEILLTKLSPQELQTLKEIGMQYGKQLRILDPDGDPGAK